MTRRYRGNDQIEFWTRLCGWDTWLKVELPYNGLQISIQCSGHHARKGYLSHCSGGSGRRGADTVYPHHRGAKLTGNLVEWIDGNACPLTQCRKSSTETMCSITLGPSSSCWKGSAHNKGDSVSRYIWAGRTLFYHVYPTLIHWHSSLEMYKKTYKSKYGLFKCVWCV